VRRLTGRPGVPIDVFGWAQRHGWEAGVKNGREKQTEEWWFGVVWYGLIWEDINETI